MTNSQNDIAMGQASIVCFTAPCNTFLPFHLLSTEILILCFSSESTTIPVDRIISHMPELNIPYLYFMAEYKLKWTGDVSIRV